MDTGKIFLGAVFLIIAAYIVFYVPSPAAKIFGGGILALLGLLTLAKAFKKQGNKEIKQGSSESEEKREE